MNSRHRALIVEDDLGCAKELEDLLNRIGCDSVAVTNRREALEQIHASAFCLLLVDLEIHAEPGSIQGRREHGHAVLEAARERYPQRAGRHDLVPIVVVSASGGDTDEVLCAMRDGASDVLHKLAGDKLDRIVRALEAAGRTTHERCVELASKHPELGSVDRIVSSISADRVGQRFGVTLGGQVAHLPPASLETLLRLVVASKRRERLNVQNGFGTKRAGGFRLISELRQDLRLASSQEVIANDKQGNYWLEERVEIGEIRLAMLETLTRAIPKLAREIRSLLAEKPRSPRGA